MESRFGYTSNFELKLKDVTRELRLTLSRPDPALKTVDVDERETIGCYRATLEVVVFPGAVATQREAPTLQEVVSNLDSLLAGPTQQ